MAIWPATGPFLDTSLWIPGWPFSGPIVTIPENFTGFICACDQRESVGMTGREKIRREDVHLLPGRRCGALAAGARWHAAAGGSGRHAAPTARCPAAVHQETRGIARAGAFADIVWRALNTRGKPGPPKGAAPGRHRGAGGKACGFETRCRGQVTCGGPATVRCRTRAREPGRPRKRMV